MNILSYHSCQIDGETALLTFSLPVAVVDDFKNCMMSVGALTHYTAIKTRHQQAIHKVRSAEYQVELQRKYDVFSSRILKRYDHFISVGSTPRQAFRQVRDEHNSKGGHTTCYSIELICRGAGRLSKRKAKVS